MAQFIILYILIGLLSVLIMSNSIVGVLEDCENQGEISEDQFNFFLPIFTVVMVLIWPITFYLIFIKK